MCKECGDTGTIYTGNKALPFIDCGCVVEQPRIISLADHRSDERPRRKAA